MTHDPTRDCEHGRLKGKCEVCDLQAIAVADKVIIEYHEATIKRLQDEVARLQKVEDAAKNLVKVKGRYHTEQAFNKLKELVQ